MNIVEPYAQLVKLDDLFMGVQKFTPIDGTNKLRKIEFCGRISHRSEDKMTDSSWERFIKAVVLEHGDWSIVEHADATVDMLVDRGITHEIVRHRLFSFTQESTRFVNYEKKMQPSFIKPLMPEDSSLAMPAEDWWADSIGQAEESYKRMLGLGCTPQIARSVFPNALASRIIITGNLRNWRHFFIMRTTKESHPQMRQVTLPLLQQFKDCIPLLFDDLEPMAKQSENLKKPR